MLGSDVQSIMRSEKVLLDIEKAGQRAAGHEAHTLSGML